MGRTQKPQPSRYMPYITPKIRQEIQQASESTPDVVLAKAHMILAEQVREIRQQKRRG